jgi:TetR/AcrR family transcriptional regulator, tetracycline repressor protein
MQRWERSEVDEQQRPGPKRGLSVEQVVNEAFGILADGGVTGFSMRKLASELGVTTMALYTYFPSRDALMEHLADECIGRCPVAPPSADDWRARLRAHQIEVADALAGYRGLVGAIVAARGPSNSHGVRNSNDVLELLIGAGFDQQQASDAYGSLSMLLRGFLEMTADRSSPEAADRYVVALDLMLDALGAKLAAGASEDVIS